MPNKTILQLFKLYLSRTIGVSGCWLTHRIKFSECGRVPGTDSSALFPHGLRRFFCRSRAYYDKVQALCGYAPNIRWDNKTNLSVWLWPLFFSLLLFGEI